MLVRRSALVLLRQVVARSSHWLSDFVHLFDLNRNMLSLLGRSWHELRLACLISQIYINRDDILFAFGVER